MHEIGESAGLAMVDGVAGEGIGYGVEVFEDGGVVFHVDKADEGDGVSGGWGMGLEAANAAAPVVIEAEIAAVEGGHGAAGASEAEVAAAGVVGSFADTGIVRVHLEVFLRFGVKEKAQPELGLIRSLR